MKQCLYCKREIDDTAVYCQTCGKKQVLQHSQTFYRQGISEDEFIQKINAWFAQYPYVANVECQFQMSNQLGVLVNKVVLDAMAIRYECLSGENKYQYGLVTLQNFGLLLKSGKDIIQEWKAANPGAIILKTEGRINQRGDSGSLAFGGIGATNRTQVYVFFKFIRGRGTGR